MTLLRPSSTHYPYTTLFRSLESSDPNSEWFIKDAGEREELLEDRDEYASHNVFWVPQEARWEKLQSNAKQPEIGKMLDDAMARSEEHTSELQSQSNFVCRIL